MLKIAITGHRNLLNEREIRENIALSLQYFQKIDPDLQAISALAVGADTIFAQEANRLNIPVRYILPFALEDYQEDFTSAPQLKTLQDLLAQNNNQYEVESPLKDTKPETRNEAYFAVGKRLVDECDIVLAVWDGQPAQGKGGTGDVVAYAREQGKEVHIIQGLRPKSEKQNEEILFDKLDKTAIRYKELIFQPAWYIGLLLAIIGVVFFAKSMAFHSDFITAKSKLTMAFYEISCIILSAILILLVARQYKNLFLDNRRNAEYLRTLLRFQQMNIDLPKISVSEISETKNAKHPIEIKPEILAFEHDLSLPKKEGIMFEDAKRNLWTFTQGQINYHEKTRLKPLKFKEKIIHQVLEVLKWVFYVSLAIKVIIEIQHFLHEIKFHLPHIPIDSLLPWLNLLLIVTPSVFAVLETVKSFEEWDRNKDESEKMVAKLEKVRTEIFDSNNEISLKHASKNLRIQLEKENTEWAERVASLTPGVHI